LQKGVCRVTKEVLNLQKQCHLEQVSAKLTAKSNNASIVLTRRNNCHILLQKHLKLHIKPSM